MGKFALVTGSCGFIGSHMVDYLLNQGYRVRATDLAYAPKTYLNVNAEFMPADLTQKEDIPALLKDIDLVFHFAAIFNFSVDLDIALKVNTGGTKNLLDGCRNFPNIQRIVIASSGAVYDAIGHKPPESGFDEKGPVKGRNNYTISKLEQERISLQYWQDYGLPIVIIRFAGAYGPRSFYGIASIIIFLAKGQLPVIPGKGDKPAALVHVFDAVRAAEFLSGAAKETIGQIYNVADETTDTVADLIKYASHLIPDTKIYGSVPSWMIKGLINYSEWLAKKNNNPPKIERGMMDYVLYAFRMDNCKIKALGFEFKHPQIKEQLKKVIDWYGPLFREGENQFQKIMDLTQESKSNTYLVQKINYRLEKALGSFILDPFLLIIFGAFSVWLTVRKLYKRYGRKKFFIPCLAITTLIFFWLIAGFGLYLDNLNVPLLGEMGKGNHFMWNSGLELLGIGPFIDTTVPTYTNWFSPLNILALFIFIVVYPLFLRLGIEIGFIFFGRNEKQTGFIELLK